MLDKDKAHGYNGATDAMKERNGDAASRDLPDGERQERRTEQLTLEHRQEMAGGGPVIDRARNSC